MKKKKQVFELTIDEFTGVDAIALVQNPAIEKDFLYFSNTRYNFTESRVDTERRIVTGPAIIPDKEIIRYNEQTNEEFFVWFSQDTVRKIAEKFMIEKKLDNVNLEHNPDLAVSDVSLVEAWIVEDPDNDKANALGYSVNKGTLMVSYKVNNFAVLDKIKSGEVKGFSIEGAFVQGFSAMSKVKAKIETPVSIDTIQEEYIKKLLAQHK